MNFLLMILEPNLQVLLISISPAQYQFNQKQTDNIENKQKPSMKGRIVLM